LGGYQLPFRNIAGFIFGGKKWGEDGLEAENRKAPHEKETIERTHCPIPGNLDAIYFRMRQEECIFGNPKISEPPSVKPPPDPSLMISDGRSKSSP
jgi:hypothetical protein